MDINERFEIIIKEVFNNNKRAFAKAVGISPTVVENVVGTRKGKPSYDVLAKVCANANISAGWLLFGEGDMLRAESSVELNELNESRSQNIIVETRPRIPYEAAAGTLSIAINPVHRNDCEHIPVIPTFPRYDFTIVTRGDSMLPDFHSGDELACAFVKESSFIQWGRVHVLDTAQGIVLKKIFDGKKNIVCKSINKEYPDFEVPKDEIYHIAIVVGLIRHF